MLPNLIKPMLAQSADAPFDSEQHLFEIKWDGIRCLAFIESGCVRLQSRHLTELTVQFPELAGLHRLPSGTVLDGELVVFQDAKPCLRVVQQRALVQNRARILLGSRVTPATYTAFDLLYLKGQSFMAEQVRVRRQALEELIHHRPVPGVLVSGGVLNHGCRLLERVARLGLEGVMAKRLDSPYLPGKRSRHWFKIKPRPSAQVLSATSAMAGSI